MGNVMPFAPIWLFRQVVKTSVRKTDVAGSNPARALYAQAQVLKSTVCVAHKCQMHKVRLKLKFACVKNTELHRRRTGRRTQE